MVVKENEIILESGGGGWDSGKTFPRSALQRSHSTLNTAHGMILKSTKIWFKSKLEKNDHTPLILETKLQLELYLAKDLGWAGMDY